MAHGRAVTELLQQEAPRSIRLFARLKHLSLEQLAHQAAAWLDHLPEHVQEEIDGMARAAHVPHAQVRDFLFADIATPGHPPDPRAPQPPSPPASRTTPDADLDAPIPGEHTRPSPSDPDTDPPDHAEGPMCSGLIARSAHAPWVARNCDWYTLLLRRGTAAVIHELPGRIPVMALGIRGDIDVDTGINAERLWLHLHTLHATDTPRQRRTLSWLFWAREALETCDSLDTLEQFIQRVDRDRGVIVFAADGKTGQSALFECERTTHRRLEPEDGLLYATNHRRTKHPTPDRAQRSRQGSTIARCEHLRTALHTGEPLSAPPGSLMGLLANPDIEMHKPTHLRTIYATVCRPDTGEIWFAPGQPDGTPAASRGQWQRIPWPW